jgi:signal transduction histidine kinase/CheY-like chemotaxis protein
VPDSLLYQLILLCFLSISSAMVIMEVAYHRTIYWITLCGILLPLIVRASIESAGMVAISAALVLVYTLLHARAANHLILESLRLRFINQSMVAQLEAEKSLAEAARLDAVEANRAKSRFLAAASHDLRQPMHALGLYASAARPYMPAGAGQHILDKIGLSIESAELMFNALLDISRLEAGILVPEIRPFAIDTPLNRLKTEYAPLADEKGLMLRVRPCARHVVSDPLLVERVIRNYLSNALRYTRRGGVLVGCRVRGEHLRIEVWDTGEGIPPDQFNNIYQGFYQLGNPERDRRKGLGLGLTIVKRIGELLSHPISVQSTLARGSMFSITVPLTSATAQPSADNSPPFDESWLLGSTVLIIDDEPDVLEAMAIVLKQWGCHVLTAQSQAQALEALRELDRAPDALIADYRLREGKTGIEAIKAIHQVWGMTAVALLTGDTSPDRLIDATNSGYPLLHKPISPLRLKETLCRILAAAPAT